MSTYISVVPWRAKAVLRVVLHLLMVALILAPAFAQGDTGTPPAPQVPSPGDSALFALTKARLDSFRNTLIPGRISPADSLRVAQLRAALDSLTSRPDPLRFTNLKARSDITKGVIAGGMVTLEMSRAPGLDTPTVRIINLDTSGALDMLELPIFEIDGTNLIIAVPDSVPRGMYLVQIFNGSSQPVLLERPHHLRVEKLWRVLIWSLAPIVLIIFLLAWVLSIYRKRNDLYRKEGEKKRNLIGMLLLEPANHTYSLSRAQFVYWTFIIASSYVFLFVARGLVESVWIFPSLEGFAWTFLISLGTLLVAQGTSSAKGVKGAGEFNPSPADLFVHGGVIALERVQQVLWTLIASGLFVFILIKTYSVSTTIPTIPEQLLYLMGISSAGYLAGKAIRKPGPIIDQIAFLANPHLSIKGKHLSNDAFVWVNGVQLKGDTAAVAPDPAAPSEFSSEIQVPLSDPMNTEGGWYGEPRVVTVVNADGQRAEWMSKPEIVSVDSPSAANNNTLTIVTRYVSPAATWAVNGTSKQLLRSTTQPDRWTIAYTAPETIKTVMINSVNGTTNWPAVVPAPPQK